MSNSYFIVRYDGVHGPLTEEEVLERITPDEAGDTYYGHGLRFLTKLPDLGEFSERDVVVLRGSIVVPTPKTVVQTFSLHGGSER